LVLAARAEALPNAVGAPTRDLAKTNPVASADPLAVNDPPAPDPERPDAARGVPPRVIARTILPAAGKIAVPRPEVLPTEDREVPEVDPVDLPARDVPDLPQNRAEARSSTRASAAEAASTVTNGSAKKKFSTAARNRSPARTQFPKRSISWRLSRSANWPKR